MNIDEQQLNQDEKEILFAQKYVEACCPGAKIQKIEGEAKPDILVIENNIVVEIKEVVKADELEKSVEWSNSTAKLKDEIRRLNAGKSYSGIYSVTSDRFKATKNKTTKRIAKSIFNAISEGQSECVDGARFTIRKVDDSNDLVVMFGAFSGGLMDSTRDLAVLLSRNIEKASKQLGGFSTDSVGQKNVILLINRFQWASGTQDFAEALSLDLGFLLKVENVDEIWFCNFFNGKLSQAHLIFDSECRDFFEQRVETIEVQKLLPWIRGIMSKNPELNSHLFKFVSTELRNICALGNDWGIRADLVDLCSWIANRDDPTSVLTVIDELMGLIKDLDAEEDDGWANQFSVRIA